MIIRNKKNGIIIKSESLRLGYDKYFDKELDIITSFYCEEDTFEVDGKDWEEVWDDFDKKDACKRLFELACYHGGCRMDYYGNAVKWSPCFKFSDKYNKFIFYDSCNDNSNNNCYGTNIFFRNKADSKLFATIEKYNKLWNILLKQ